MKIKTLSILSFFMTTLLTSPIHAETIEGVIKGANCHTNEHQCSTDEAASMLEHEFVLVSGGKYFVLKNFPVEEKRSLNKLQVKVSGELNKQIIDVQMVSVKNAGKYELVWDLEEIYSELYES